MALISGDFCRHGNYPDKCKSCELLEATSKLEAASKLCEIYFDIAAQFHPGGEKGVRADRDAIIKVTTGERE